MQLKNLFKPIFIVILLLSLLYSNPAKCQINAYPNEGGKDAETFQGFIGYNSAVRNDPNKPYVKGTCYLHKGWKKADVVVARQDSSYLAKDIWVKIDILNNIIEVNYFGQLNLLPIAQLHSVILKDEIGFYVSNKAISNDAPRGIYKVLVNAKNTLLVHQFPKSKAKTDNLDRTSTLGVSGGGETGVDIIVTEEYFGLLNNELIKIEKNRKRFIYQFEEQDNVAQYIKSNKINPKNEKSLTNFFIYINSL